MADTTYFRYKCVKDHIIDGAYYNAGRVYLFASSSPPNGYFEAFAGEVYSQISPNLSVDLDGTAYFAYTGWEDMRFPATRVRRGATSKPDFDYTNLGLLFPQNDDAEKIYISEQMPHAWQQGTPVRPHVHWIQESEDVPVWKLQYRFINNGDTPGAFTTLTSASEAFTYVSGSLAQISLFPEIALGSFGTSALFDFIFYRDDNVVSGDVLVKTFDFHYKVDSFGSGQEYYK